MIPSTRYAGFWIRFVANLIDWFILDLGAALLQAAIFAILFGLRRLAGHSESFLEAFPPLLLQIANIVVYAGLCVPYYVGLQLRTGATWGKRIVGVRVVQAESFAPMTRRQAWVRCLSYLASYLPLGCGFLMAAFHPQKRGLHDLIAGTVSIREAARNSSRV